MAYDYDRILAELALAVEAAGPNQVLDPSRIDHGCWYTGEYGMPVADHTTHSKVLAQAGYCLLAPHSPLEGDSALTERVLAGIAFVGRMQRDTGLIDLPKVDFDSPPDTAFLVQQLCPILELTQKRSDVGDAVASHLKEVLTPVLDRAARGVIGRGFRTPNHRWVVCSALAYASTLLPDLDVRDYVDTIVAEGIDINADGDWSERSSAVYNAVCDRAMRLMADHLDMPTLLDHVRANLELTILMLEPDGSVITAGSRRQDQGSRVPPSALADSFMDMAIRDGNGRFAEMADRLACTTVTDQSEWRLHPLLTHGRDRADAVTRRPILDRYTRHFERSRLWRARRGEFSVTAAATPSAPISVAYRHIAASLDLRGNYFNLACFQADVIEPTDAGVRLRHLGLERMPPGWDLPLNRPVVFDNPHEGYYPLASDGTRDRWLLPPLDITMELKVVDDGFDLAIKTHGGLDRIPFVLEFRTDTGEYWETTDAAIRASEGQCVVLKAGNGTFVSNGQAIALTPGCDAHRAFHAGATVPKPGGFLVQIPLVTPVEYCLSLRCGSWSEAERRIVNLLPGPRARSHRLTPSTSESE
ncbi:MAG: hypothetical protein AAF711_00045 [Planctomycetota bacterium]